MFDDARFAGGAGPSFFIEESKRRMIAEDIAAALRFAKISQQGQRREPT